jgi:energy-coupling factor transport system permease protein
VQLDFSFKETWIHQINPSLKLLLFVALFFHIIFIHDIDFIINYTFIALFLLVFFSGHPWKRVLLLAIPFLLVFISTSTSMIFFGQGQTTWLKWGLLHITEESFYRGVHLGFRALNFAALGLLFALTTRPVFLFYSLMQQLKLPPKFAYSFMAAFRLIPIMFEEFQVLRYALKVRGVKEKRGIKGIYEKIKFFSIPLLAQSIRRAQRIAVAMEAKRFSMIKKRTYYYELGFSRYDVLFILYLGLTITAAYYISQQLPYFDIRDVRNYG